MSYDKKIVLHCPNGYSSRLDVMVEDFIRDGVMFVGVVGEDCSRVEDIIDELVVADGTRDYDLLTSSHPNETVDEVVQFAKGLGLKFANLDVQIVVL